VDIWHLGRTSIKISSAWYPLHRGKKAEPLTHDESQQLPAGAGAFDGILMLRPDSSLLLKG
jgi:hypothetical protein